MTGKYKYNGGPKREYLRWLRGKLFIELHQSIEALASLPVPTEILDACPKSQTDWDKELSRLIKEK